MTIGSRFKILRGDKSQSEFADLIKSNKQNISRYEKDIMMPGGDVLLKLATVLRVNINWLLTGEGNQYVIAKYPIKDWTKHDKLSLVAEKKSNRKIK